MKATAAILFLWFTVSVGFLSVASAVDKTSARPSYWIIVNDGTANECTPGYVVLQVTQGPDDRVVSAIVLDSKPMQIFDNAALNKVQGMSVPGQAIDENRNFLVGVQFKISVHQLNRCTDTESAS